jgi:hypothetical protein
MAHFFDFVLNNRVPKEQLEKKDVDLEKLAPILKAYENAVLNLKKSIRNFERFEETIGDLGAAQN